MFDTQDGVAEIERVIAPVSEDDEGDCDASCGICGKACTKAARHSGQHWCSTHQGY